MSTASKDALSYSLQIHACCVVFEFMHNFLLYRSSNPLSPHAFSQAWTGKREGAPLRKFACSLKWALRNFVKQPRLLLNWGAFSHHHACASPANNRPSTPHPMTPVSWTQLNPAILGGMPQKVRVSAGRVLPALWDKEFADQ